jgi:caa(3)-type oxidase subunit IV
MSEPTAHHATAHDHGDRKYWVRAIWLTALTIVEVGAAVALHGREGMMGIKLLILSSLAVWKAGIVLQHFMHLTEEGKGLKLILLFPVFLIVFLVSVLCIDSVVFGYAT